MAYPSFFSCVYSTCLLVTTFHQFWTATLYFSCTINIYNNISSDSSSPVYTFWIVLYFFIFFTEVWLNYNVLLITAVHKSDSPIWRIYILFHILFHYGLSHESHFILKSMEENRGPTDNLFISHSKLMNRKVRTSAYPFTFPIFYVFSLKWVWERSSFLKFHTLMEQFWDDICYRWLWLTNEFLLISYLK